MSEFALFGPAWSRHGPVRAASTTRRGGLATGSQATFSLDLRPEGSAEVLAANRRRLRRALELPSEPLWLRQVHGTGVVDAARHAADELPEADAAWTSEPGVVCAVLTADCLPVVVADREGRAAAVSHAGWRGLAAGVIEATIAAMPVEAGALRAWLGPAIGPGAFEVGPEVRAAFVDQHPDASGAFRPADGDRWFADLYSLACQRLRALGVSEVTGGVHCTVTEERHFFSHRRDGRAAGRMATLAWIDPART